MTTKTEFRTYLSKNWAYRNHWIRAFSILEFDKKLSIDDNFKLFSSFAYSNTWKNVKKRLFLMDYEVGEDLKIKKLKGGNK